MKLHCLVLLSAAFLAGGCSTNMEWCCATYGTPVSHESVPVPEYLSSVQEIPQCSALKRENDRPVYSNLNYDFFRSNNRPMAELQADFSMSVELEHRRTKERFEVFVTVPRGFVTDFTSRPIGSGLFVSNFGRHVKGSTVHDWLYAVGYAKNQGGEKFADQVFFQTVRDAGEHWFGRFMIMTPLRIWPSTNYNGDRERIFWVRDDDLDSENPMRVPANGYLYGASQKTADDLRRKTVRICPKNRSGSYATDPEGAGAEELEDLLRNLRGTEAHSDLD